MKTRFTKRKTLFSFVFIALMLGMAAAAVLYETAHNDSAEDGEPRINRLHASYIIDVYNPAALVGDVDYVFAAKVDKMTGNTYKDPVMIEDAFGKETIEVTSPHTNYMITVLDNIKGELVAGESIPVEKAGGLSKDGKTITLHENDSLPEVGKVYIFLAYTQPDGTLQISGPKSNIEIGSVDSLEADSAFSIRESPEYLKMVDAYENQIVRERDRTVSIYDTAFKN
ncbi:MAG: hypothetical protein LBU81_08410 [Methanosarcinales archaeon]|jgi:hypothetical protein|nr:hypothetical protein [Methanosarcinales archaeon]